MELIIRNNSGQPIYDQISGQIKAQILSGALSPGDALPSIRGLAKDLKISVITTKRAYDELEAQGLINTVAGKGCFVAEPDLALFREQSLHLLEDHLAAAAELARTCGLSEPELAELLRQALTDTAIEQVVKILMLHIWHWTLIWKTLFLFLKDVVN